jgi:hypothetical protein
MSAATFAPRAGTAGARVLALLEANPGVGYRARDLCTACDVPKTSLNSATRPLVQHGLITCEGKGTATVYTLAGPALPADGPLQMAAYSDGDVSVAGGQHATDGSVLYTRAQLQQLVDFIARPHVTVSTGSDA